MAGQRVIAPLLATLLLVGTVSAQDCSDACSGMVISTSTVKTHYCIDRIEMILKLEAEGGYGPTLQAAVLKFQRNNGLPADGVVGPSTWTALLKACNASQAPACTPSNVQLPAWSGGTTEELACAVKSLAISMGLKEQQQWAYIMATGGHGRCARALHGPSRLSSTAGAGLLAHMHTS
jgi:hypothetical protein